MKIVRLTNLKGNSPLYVNMDNVMTFHKVEDGTMLHFTTGKALVVTDEPGEVYSKAIGRCDYGRLGD